MALDPLPPPPSETLTPKPTRFQPKKPPDPSIAVIFPERTPYRATENPFRETIPKETEEEYKRLLSSVTEGIRAPFSYDNEGAVSFDGESVGVNLSSETFNAAVITVIAAIERGYYPARDPTPLSTRDWARLACSLVAAIGRGYHRQNTPGNEAVLEKVRKDLTDPNPLAQQYPTLFHRLAAMAENLEFCLSPDLDNYKDWYGYIRHKTEKEMAKLATIEAKEKWREWKADQIDRRAAAQEAEIAEAVRTRNSAYFMSSAFSIGLNAVFEGPFDGPRPVPTTGKKRTASGTTPIPCPSTPVATRKKPSKTSSPTPGPSTPVSNKVNPPSMALDEAPAHGTPVATRLNPPRAAKRSSPSTTPRGRSATPIPHTPSRTDPSPTPRSKKAPPNLGAAIGETGQLDAKTIMAAVQAAMHPFMTRLDALERVSMPPPQAQHNPRESNGAATRTENSRTRTWQPAAGSSRVSETVTSGRADESAHRDDQEFIPVKRRNRKKRNGQQGDAIDTSPPQPQQINLTPASYAGVAAAAANTLQGTAPSKGQTMLPTITEVTVLRSGGHTDNVVEQHIRARAADAIVREVRLNMAKAVAKPIPLRAGRWSVHPRSKGNFVYSFNGHIPFDIISSYEHILLRPFQGIGQLCPSLGWTRVLVHGVPALNEENTVFGPDALLTEVRSLPGLRKAFFSMPPRWLKPVNDITSTYSTITFAVSDPDGSITSNLLNGRTALFGKEVKVQKWIDKPLLVQCSRCHALGHNKASRACPLGRNSVRCYMCGGAHRSEEHDQRCTRKHAVAGICDCTYKCINCQKPGHHCREERCPARSLFRPRNTKRTERARDKGKGRDPAEGPGLPPARTRVEEVDEQTYDLFNPPPPANLSSSPARVTRSRSADTSSSQEGSHSMDVDKEPPAGQGASSETQVQQVYSPSRTQPSAAVVPTL
jgi:hypothetical protein